jgi:hypothetical protein
MNIRAEIAELFRHYVDHPDNIVDGETNWDFVEADIMMRLSVDRITEEMGSLEAFYPYFNELVDLHLASEAV